MKAFSTLLLLITCAIGAVGCTHFLCLSFGIPVVIAPAASGLIVFFAGRRMTHVNKAAQTERIPPDQLFLICVGIALIVNRCYYVAEVHGGWDAWSMWNHKAKILSHPAEWRCYLRNAGSDHPDYPMLLPAFNALFMHLGGDAGMELLPFATAFLTTLLIPLLLFTELGQFRWIGGAFLLFFFATNDDYLFQGTSQYADTMLGLFFLAAIAAMREGLKNVPQPAHIYPALAGFFAGCAAFTKNEGVLFIVLLTIVFFIPLIRRKRLIHYLAGAALPLLALAAFRIQWPAANDLIGVKSLGDISSAMLDGEKWAMVFGALRQLLAKEYLLLWIVLWLVLAIGVARRQWPDRNLSLMLLLLLGYHVMYLLSPYSLEWHLQTSQARLIHGLQPALLLAAGQWIFQRESAGGPDKPASLRNSISAVWQRRKRF